MERLLLLFVFLATIEGTLRQVQVITRHGARTPFQDLPQSTAVWNCSLTALSRPDHKEENIEQVNRLYRKNYIRNRQYLPGNCATGELTLVGSQQHHELGKYFRKRYIEDKAFLPNQFDPTLFKIRSTDSPRTIASAESQLNGFYPSNETETYVIDIDTIESSEENLVPNMLCPTLVNLCEKIQVSPIWVNKANSMGPLFQKLRAIFNVTEDPWIIELEDVLTSRKFHEIPPPAGVTDDIINQINNYAFWQLNFLYTYPNVATLGIGTFLTELIEQMQAEIAGQSQEKWIYYSGHDVTIALILASLEVLEDEGWPEYASHLVFELHEDDKNEWFVKTLFRDNVIMGICNQELCPFNNFVALMGSSAITREEWLTQCDTSRQTNSPTKMTQSFC